MSKGDHFLDGHWSAARPRSLIPRREYRPALGPEPGSACRAVLGVTRRWPSPLSVVGVQRQKGPLYRGSEPESPTSEGTPSAARCIPSICAAGTCSGASAVRRRYALLVPTGLARFRHQEAALRLAALATLGRRPRCSAYESPLCRGRRRACGQALGGAGRCSRPGLSPSGADGPRSTTAGQRATATHLSPGGTALRDSIAMASLAHPLQRLVSHRRRARASSHPSSRAPADGMRLADRPSSAPAKASAVPVGHRVMRRPLPRVGPALTAPRELQVTWEESQRGTGTTVAKPTHSGRIKSML